MEIREIFLHESPLKRWFRNGIHSLLRRADARGGADIIPAYYHITVVCGSGNVNDITK